MSDLTFISGFSLLFLVPICIRSNLSFVLNHERHYLKIYCVFYFSDIQCYVIFFRENIWTFIFEFKPLPAKKPWHVIYHWIRNFKYILNVKPSFSKKGHDKF